ncbi:unnamed protein product [Rotaria sp. Silwood1]|nr:unnamed protein product [Rotaria sp. Silwood1]
MAFNDETAQTLHRHVIVWLDKYIGEPGDNEPMKERFRRVTNPIQTFVDIDSTIDFIRQQQDAEKCVFLIVSGKLGREIVPQIFNFECVAQIFIFCGNIIKHSSWSEPYRSKLQLFDSDELLLIELTNQIANHLTEEANRHKQQGQPNLARGLLEWADHLYNDADTLQHEGCRRIRADIRRKLQHLGVDHHGAN